MKNLEKQMKLAIEAVELIREFREEASILGSNFLRAATIKNEDGFILIEIDDENEGVNDYFLGEISSVFFDDMDGWSDAFHEGVSLANTELEYYYKEHSKEEFKEYVGKLKYAEYRCEEIYKRLQEIEEEYKTI